MGPWLSRYYFFSKSRKYVDSWSANDGNTPAKHPTAAGEGVFAGVFFLVSSPPHNVQVIVGFTIITKVWTVLSRSGAVSTAFCVFSSHYSHKRNSEKNKRRCSHTQPRRGDMSIETLSPAQLSPVGAACLLSKNCPNFSIISEYPMD